MFLKKIKVSIFLGMLFYLQSCADNPISKTKRSGTFQNFQTSSVPKLEGGHFELAVKKFVLNNGLKVLIVENHRLPIFSYYTFFDVGSRNEPKGLFGGTHLLEHMLFKGTLKYKEGVFQQLIEEKGGDSNAYTTSDATVYHANLPSVFLPTIIDLESDRMSNLVLDPVSFEKEKLVVLEERRMRYENSPPARAHQRLLQEMYKGTPYEHAVIGSNSDIKNLKKDEVYDYFKRYYAPNNAILVIVGDVDALKTQKLLEEKYGKIPAAPDLNEFKKRANDPQQFVVKGGRGEMIRLHGPNMAGQFMLAYKGEAAGQKRSYAMDILASLLSDGESSFLVQKYVMGPKPILSSVSVVNDTDKYAGIFYLHAEALEKVTMKVAREKLLKDFKSLCKEAINERNVQKVKNQYFISFYENLKTNSGVATLLGTMESFFEDYNFYKKELASYEAVTEADVSRVCKDILGSDNWLFVSLWKKNSEEKVP